MYISKFASFLIIGLLLQFSVTFAGRPEPAFHDATHVKTQSHVVEAQQVKEESCGGGVGEELEECLRRMTLDAHLDYIYTQNHKP